MREIVTKRSPFQIYLTKHDDLRLRVWGAQLRMRRGSFFWLRSDVNGRQMSYVRAPQSVCVLCI